MTLNVNGARRDLHEGRNLEELLEDLGISSLGVAVAINGECVPRRRYAETKLEDHDEVEILSPHQGG